MEMPFAASYENTKRLPGTPSGSLQAPSKNRIAGRRDEVAAIWQHAHRALAEVENILREANPGPGNLGDAARYQLSTGGKRWRPALLLAVAQATGTDMKAACRVAAAVELLHHASLVHDDLADGDTVRRGYPTVWKKYGTGTALNLGDYLIAASNDTLCGSGLETEVTLRLLRRFSETTKKVVEGHDGEVSAIGSTQVSVDDYRHMALAKSGLLMALPVESALILASISPKLLTPARTAARYLGLAYQIQDDLNDILGKKAGRRPGSDLRQRRMSLPSIMFYASSPRSAQDSFAAFLAQPGTPAADQVGHWVEAIAASAAPEQCRRELLRTTVLLNHHLGALPAPLRGVLESGRDLVLTQNVSPT